MSKSKETGTDLVPSKTQLPSLLQIEANFRSLMEMAEENDGDLTEEQFQALEISREQLRQKVINYRNFIDVLKAEVNTAEYHMENLKKFSQKRQNLIDRMETTLLKALMTFGEVDKNGVYRLEVVGEYGIASLSTRKSDQVVIEDETLIPAEYWNVPKAPEPKPNKTAIKAALKEGAKVDGARLETLYNLSIK
jgi:hypothetical protein